MLEKLRICSYDSLRIDDSFEAYNLSLSSPFDLKHQASNPLLE